MNRKNGDSSGTAPSVIAVALVLLVGNAAVQGLQSQAADEESSRNHAPVLVRPIQDLTISEDQPFKFNLRPTGSVYFGYDVGGDDLAIRDNYFASHVRFFQPWTNVIFTGNTLAVRDHHVVALNADQFSMDDFKWDHNQYFCMLARPLVFDGAQTWTAWRRQTAFDQASTIARRNPPTQVFVRANQYQPGRGHVIAYNWDHLDSVDIDLSEIVAVGASFRIYNVLGLKDEPVLAGVFDGDKVSVPMTSIPFPVPTGHHPPASLVMDQEFATFLVVSSAAQTPAKGNSFFVSTKGSADGDGSWKNPWDLTTAMLHPDSVRPGDTIWLRGGTYRGGFTSNLSGSEDAPILVRALPNEDVVIDLHDDAHEPDSLISLSGQHTWYWGFEVMSSDPSPRVTSESGSWPESRTRGDFNVTGDHLKLINLEIHDLNQGLGFWSSGTGGEANGLIIYNNGWSSSDRNHGHGIYTQNEGATRRLVDNIAFNQFRNGIMVYGSSDAALKDYHIEGNICFANGGAVGEGYVGSFQLLVGGGSPANNIVVTNNFTYDLPCHFRDDDFDDTLTYTAQCLDGQPLPRWLTLVDNEGFFYGTPDNGDVGTIAIRVTASDSHGAAVSDVFRLRVTNVNDPPHLLAPLDDIELSGQTQMSVDFSGHFTDDDASDALTLRVTLAGGAALPDGLLFDPESGVLSGRTGNLKTMSIRVTATDASGATASGVFDLRPSS